jgi:DNA-binding XRE family transcriptional regulator
MPRFLRSMRLALYPAQAIFSASFISVFAFNGEVAAVAKNNGTVKYLDRMIENLHLLRKSAKLSQAQFGEKLGVSRQTISAIENENQPLTWRFYLSMVCVFQQYEGSKALLEERNVFSSDFIKHNL